MSISVGKQERALPEALAIVDRLAAKPEKLIATIRAHNARWKKRVIREWTRKNIRGGGMRKVYKAHGIDRLPRVRDVGSAIVWTYRTSYTNRALAECEEYSFSKGGSLRKRRAYPCP